MYVCVRVCMRACMCVCVCVCACLICHKVSNNSNVNYLDIIDFIDLHSALCLALRSQTFLPACA